MSDERAQEIERTQEFYQEKLDELQEERLKCVKIVPPRYERFNVMDARGHSSYGGVQKVSDGYESTRIGKGRQLADLERRAERLEELRDQHLAELEDGSLSVPLSEFQRAMRKDR